MKNNEARGRGGPHQELSDSSILVEVLEIKPLPDAGNLRAFAKVQIGPFVLHGVRVIQQNSQRAYCALPQQQGQDGRWWPMLQCVDPGLEDLIKVAVLQAWGAIVS